MPDALVVTSSFLPGRGGIESYLAELCAELSPRLGVLAPVERDGAPIPRLPYPAIGCSTSMLRPGRAVVDAIVETARSLDTDRILFGTPWPLLLTAPALRRAGLRYGAIVHGAELVAPAAVPGLRGALGRALRAADVLYAVSAHTAERVRRLGGGARANVRRLGGGAGLNVEVLHARVDVDRFNPDAGGSDVRRRLGIPAGAPLVACFGRLVARKGIDRLIDVLPDVAGRVPGTMLVVGGTGPRAASLRRQAAQLGAPVVFVGRVADDEAPAFYAAANVFALPVADRWFGLEIEGLGVVLLEAAACGVPCVTGRSGGTPEAVVDGTTGFVVDARDRASLVDKLAWPLEHPELARRMGFAGRSYVTREFAHRPLPRSLLEWLG